MAIGNSWRITHKRIKKFDRNRKRKWKTLKDFTNEAEKFYQKNLIMGDKKSYWKDNEAIKLWNDIKECQIDFIKMFNKNQKVNIEQIKINFCLFLNFNLLSDCHTNLLNFHLNFWINSFE